MQQPIGFVSKAFDQRLSGWSTPEKEGYAIFYALEKWEYLLRDRRFTLKTDHENLTRLKLEYANNNKVQKWLLCFQAYDYNILHIRGLDNIVADSFSRLCSLNESATEGPDRICALTPFNVPDKYWHKIGAVHNSISGHGGVERTLAKLLIL
jgi:hypothetical protein